jgi:hypothetical protein
MTDLRRIVRRPSTGTVVVQDVDDQANYYFVRDSFRVAAPPRRPALSTRQRRYGGARVVAETHDNGTIAWSALVKGATTDQALSFVEDLLSVLESPATDLFFEWKPETATSSVFYEIRGPATWQPSYSAVQMRGAHSMVVDISIPVAPLAQLDRVTQDLGAITTPALVELDSIDGTAPALVDVAITGNDPAVFGLIAWAPHAVPGPSGNATPFGKHNGPDTTSGGGSWLLSMPNVTPDAFSDEVDVELWAYIKPPTTGSPRASVQVQGVTSGLSAVTNVRYTAEWGETDPPLNTAGTYQLFRLGVVTVPVDPGHDPFWLLAVSPAVGGKLKWVFAVPARSRATSPTGEPLLDVPTFFLGGGGIKTIRGQDLSGSIQPVDDPVYRDTGIGGSPIEMEPGINDFMLMLSDKVPNGLASEQGVDATVAIDVSVRLTITPRVWLAEGT